MGKWDDIKFNLIEGSSFGLNYIRINGNVLCGNILYLSKKGVHRSVDVGGEFGINLDKGKRIKFFKGCTPMTFANEINFSYTVSSLNWNNHIWYLKKNGDILVLGCSGLLVLLITPAGVYRFPTCQGTGLPCDDQGRVMVLK